MTSSQRRIFLWTHPRSMSSVFHRAMNNADGTKGIFHPYFHAYYLGTERISSRYGNDPPKEGVTYHDIKALLEQPYVKEKVVFVTDYPYGLLQLHPDLDMVPSGYQHTFLIRNPKKSLPSFYKSSIDKEQTGWDHFEPKEAGYKELHQFYTLVTENLKQKTVILDADDIQCHPEDMLQQYCEFTGQEFQRVMLNWDEAPPEKMDFVKGFPLGWFGTLLSSTTFNKLTSPSNPIDVAKEPHAVQQAIKENQPYYDKLYSLRLKPRNG